MATTNNVRNLTADQGSTKSFVITCGSVGGDPFDLTGYDARLQVRAAYASTSTIVNATLQNGKLVLTNAANGIITWILNPADTSSARFKDADADSMDCVYDLEIISPIGAVYKPARGTLTLNREVTR